ncbi:MAG: amino acid dehydrogenase [Gemmatimonadetes bacterium]|nr:amino acid dehydrogenase [Gemmatimonadota bacterium]
MYDPDTGYRGIIAIHSTILGPALGGTRLWNYESEDEALTDVLRLSRGMTAKAAVAGLHLGGGKSVILADDKITDREALFHSHGRHVQSLGGRYTTAEDVGTNPSDMAIVREETEYVVGLEGRSGDPSPVTAFGVYRAMKACAKFKYGDDSLAGKTVSVKGLGHVGYHLCDYLHKDGAALVVADIDQTKVDRVMEEFGATAVDHEAIYGVDADIFAPCALGAGVNDDTIDEFKVDIIAGSANNQLAHDRNGDALDERGIIYAPDYVANGGGLINVNAELAGWTLEEAHAKAGEIYHTMLGLLEIARDEGIPSYKAARRLAQRRIDTARRRAAVAS